MRALVLACGLAFSAGLATAAEEPANLLYDFSIETWSQSDGLPAAWVRAIAQDTAGYLWLGTDAGLYRFDGLHFTPISRSSSSLTATSPIRALCASRDGALWVGLGTGHVVRLKGPTVKDFGVPGRLHGGAIGVLAEDAHGNMWAGGPQGLFKRSTAQSDGEWVAVGEALGTTLVLDARFDRSGRLLVVTGDAVLRGNADNSAFERLSGSRGDPREIIESPDGTLYQTDSFSGFHEVGTTVGSTPPYGPTRGRHLAIDRDGALWVGTGGQGLWRWTRDRTSGRHVAATITPSSGLPAGGVVALMEDRERNIWVGTPAGLSRLTRRKVRLIQNLLLVAGAEQTPDGSAWVGAGDELIRFSRGAASERTMRRWPLDGAQMRALTVDERGTLWVATDQFLARESQGQLVRVPLAGPFPRRIDSITGDFQGGIIAYDSDRGVLRLRGDRFETVRLPPEAIGQAVIASHTDVTGTIWLAFAGGSIVQLSAGDRVVLHSAASGEQGRRIVDIAHDDRGGLWFTGDFGLMRFRDGVFSTLRREQGFFASSLTSLVTDTAGNLWIGSNLGITSVERKEIDAAFADPGYEPTYITYDLADGLAGLPVMYSRNRNPLRRPNGDLWFLTGQGITVVDPATMESRRTSPKVYIETLSADDSRFETAPTGPLPPRTTRIDVEYSALDVTFAGRTRFRYQLEGYDPEWVAAGTRRQASYANLPPKTYRFRVSASGADGRWVDQDAVWEFSIKPVFYRTPLFITLLCCSIAAATWGAWRIHLRRLRRDFVLLFTERARVSREIHDRLLQNLVALTLEFDAAAFDTPHSGTKDQLVRWRKKVEQYIGDARQSIWNLRAPASHERGLPTAIREACERASPKPAGLINFEVQGPPRSCTTNVEEQVVQIAQEAVINAVRHAAPEHVTVSLRYDDQELRLAVADDGIGFDVGVQRASSNGHYGLKTMKERAESVGGRLAIVSESGAGTIVNVSIPSPVSEAQP